MSVSMEELVTEMLNAVESDIDSLEKGKPGLAKLSMLAKVEDLTSKQSLQDSFIDAGGLSAIREWLRLLPDQSLPNLTIRSALLRILQKLAPSITLENLRESKVGHAVRDIIFHEEEIASNKRIANEIAESWLRQVFGRDLSSINANVARATDTEMQQAALVVRRPYEPEEPEDGDDPEDRSKRRTSAISALLKNAGKESHLFKVQPVSKVRPATSQKIGAGLSGERINKMVSQRQLKKSTNSKVSIEGRGLH